MRGMSSRMQAEARYVEAALGGKLICDRCGASLDTYADQCSANLDDACPGFVAIDKAKADFNRDYRPT